MHIPDGFLSPPVAAAAGLVSAGGVGAALSRLKPEAERGLIPRMGLTAAYVFGAQMINFPVAGGTSGHLLGALLAAVLLGPTAGTVVMAAVFIIQTFFFLDGGHTALGANILNMGLAGTFGGYAAYRALAGPAPSMRRCLSAAGIAAWLSVMLGASLTAMQLAISGAVPARVVFPAMLGIHTVIGLGEAAITVAALSLLWRVRPALITGRGEGEGGRQRWGWALVAGLALLAVLAPLKSDFPDGLEWVAEQLAFISREADPLLGGPFGDYELPGLAGVRWAAILVSLLGAGLMVGSLYLLGLLSRAPRLVALGPGRRLDARVRLVCLLALVLTAVLVPAQPAGRLWVLFSVALLWAVTARVSARWLVGRLLLLVPFILMVTLSVPLVRNGDMSVVGSMLLRAGTSLLATAAFVQSTPEADALGAMHALRMPRALADTIAFALRYFRVMTEDAGRMLRARAARSAGTGTLALRGASTGALVGSLFLRSFERSERISLAMEARGFQGHFPVDEGRRLTAQDWVFLAGAVFFVVGVCLWR